jgi:hypothetical protein
MVRMGGWWRAVSRRALVALSLSSQAGVRARARGSSRRPPPPPRPPPSRPPAVPCARDSSRYTTRVDGMVGCFLRTGRWAAPPCTPFVTGGTFGGLVPYPGRCRRAGYVSRNRCYTGEGATLLGRCAPSPVGVTPPSRWPEASMVRREVFASQRRRRGRSESGWREQPSAGCRRRAEVEPMPIGAPGIGPAAGSTLAASARRGALANRAPAAASGPRGRNMPAQ